MKKIGYPVKTNKKLLIQFQQIKNQIVFIFPQIMETKKNFYPKKFEKNKSTVILKTKFRKKKKVIKT